MIPVTRCSVNAICNNYSIMKRQPLVPRIYIWEKWSASLKFDPEYLEIIYSKPKECRKRVRLHKWIEVACPSTRRYADRTAIISIISLSCGGRRWPYTAPCTARMSEAQCRALVFRFLWYKTREITYLCKLRRWSPPLWRKARLNIHLTPHLPTNPIIFWNIEQLVAQENCTK